MKRVYESRWQEQLMLSQALVWIIRDLNVADAFLLAVANNMEMQCENQGNLPKRSRFHQAEMDVMSIAPGTDFNEMQPSFVIFIFASDSKNG